MDESSADSSNGQSECKVKLALPEERKASLPLWPIAQALADALELGEFDAAPLHRKEFVLPTP